MRYIFLILLLTACATPKKNPDATTWQKSCGKNYCHTVTGQNPKLTLWYIPGVLESKDVVQKSPFEHDEFKQLNDALGPMTIITLSYDKAWFVGKDPSHAQLINLVKIIEGKHKPVKPFILSGHSLGGANAVILATLMPNKFDKLVLTNPMLISKAIDPFKILQICPGCLLITTNFKKDEWPKYDPFNLVEKSKSMPPSYITGCSQDKFKLFEGGQQMSWALSVKNNNAIFYSAPTPCDHYSFDTKKVIEWLKK